MVNRRLGKLEPLIQAKDRNFFILWDAMKIYPISQKAPTEIWQNFSQAGLQGITSLGSIGFGMHEQNISHYFSIRIGQNLRRIPIFCQF